MRGILFAFIGGACITQGWPMPGLARIWAHGKRDRYAVDRIYYGFGHFAVRPGRKQTRIGTSEAALSNRGALGHPLYSVR